MKIRQSLKAIREEKKVTIEEVSSSLNINPELILKWEETQELEESEVKLLEEFYQTHLDEDITPTKMNEIYYIVKNSIEISLFIVLLIVFLIIGFSTKKWHPTWILFIFYFTATSIFDIIEKKKLIEFDAISLTCGIYLIMGYEFDLWKMWYILLFIPIYIISSLLIDRFIINAKKC